MVERCNVMEERTASIFRVTDLFETVAKELQRKETCQLRMRFLRESGQSHMQKTRAGLNLGRFA